MMTMMLVTLLTRATRRKNNDRKAARGLRAGETCLKVVPLPGGAPCRECGAIAQLGERLNGIQEVSGSIPLSSTNLSSGLGM